MIDKGGAATGYFCPDCGSDAVEYREGLKLWRCDDCGAHAAQFFRANPDPKGDNWQDHCGEPGCDICPPSNGMDDIL